MPNIIAIDMHKKLFQINMRGKISDNLITNLNTVDIV